MRGSSRRQMVLAGLLPLVSLLLSSCHAVEDPSLDAVFTSGTRPKDSDGNDVQAHGGCIIRVNGTYYWYGESLKLPPSWISNGISLYSSQDLATWKHHGLVLDGTKQITDMPAPPPFRIERPKVIYNEQYGYFVMMWHLDTPHFTFPAVGVAVSTTPLGPFQYRHVFKPDGRDSYDMTLYRPPGSRDAYLVRSVENRFLGISKLTPDYLNSTGTLCSIAPRQEAPSIWQAGGHFYIFSSHLTGWDPNQPMLFRAPSMCGHQWEALPVPARGPGADTTFSGQAAYVLPYTFPGGKQLNIWMGDRWNPRGPGSVANATNLWLPLMPRSDGRGFYVQWTASWRIREFEWAAVDPGITPSVGVEEGGGTLLPPAGHEPPPLQGEAMQRNRIAWASVELASGRMEPFQVPGDLQVPDDLQLISQQ